MTDKFIAMAEKHLKIQDPILGRLIIGQNLISRTNPTDYFTSLCRSIIGQQVSVAAAHTIFKRFESVTKLNPIKVLNISDEEKKLIGLSRQKTAYLKDLALHFHKNPNVYKHLGKVSYEDAITELTNVKGIGVWTAQMFLMFTLGRPDVFAPDDAGLQRAMIQLYNWEKLPAKKDLEIKAAIWKPYRTIACMHLWHSLDNTPS